MKRQITIQTHHANGQPTHWPEMIACCLQNELKLSDWDFEGFEKMPFVDMNFYWSELCLKKCHHIVPEDFECNPGDGLEFIAETPEGDEFKFAPLVKCTAVQSIQILRDTDLFDRTFIKVKSGVSTASWYEIPPKRSKLTLNEGFRTPENFFESLGEKVQFEGRLIHWTDKRY